MATGATVGTTAVGARLQLGVLGPLTVTTPSGPFVPRGRLRAVLAWLALVGPEGTSPERLAELVWADGDAPVRPLRELRLLLYQLHRSVDASAVVMSQSRVGLAPGMAEIDAERFTTLLCRELARPRERAVRAALALWRGRPYPEIAAHRHAMSEIGRLQRLRALAVGELALLRLAGREPPCVVLADLYPVMAEEADGPTLAAVMAVGLALAARRGEALRALRDLEALDNGQRAWRDATEHAILLDDVAALTRQVQELQAKIGAAWHALSAAHGGPPRDDPLR